MALSPNAPSGIPTTPAVYADTGAPIVPGQEGNPAPLIPPANGPLTQSPDGNLTGNPGDSGIQDNTGPAFDMAAFWEDGKPDAAPDGTPAPVTPAAAPAVAQPMAQLQGVLDGLPFENVMTPEIMEAVGNGDLVSFNAAMKTSQQSAVKETLILAARMMSEMKANMQEAMETRFSDLNAADKSEAALFAALPFAANPAIKPIAKGVYAQALTKTKNQAAAIAMTAQYFKETMKASAPDLDFSVAPAGDRVDPANGPTEPVDWAAALLSRDPQV